MKVESGNGPTRSAMSSSLSMMSTVLVGQQHLHAHVGMQRVEFTQQGRNAFDAERIRRGDPQPAARALLQLADRAFRLVQFAGDALAMLEVDVAGLGQAELARGAMQELRAQARLQVLHLAADRGLGQLQRTRGGDEAAVLHHADEDEGVVEIACHGGRLCGSGG
jgi:hypothetical protein